MADIDVVSREGVAANDEEEEEIGATEAAVGAEAEEAEKDKQVTE